jgi:hypothetical protein
MKHLFKDELKVTLPKLLFCVRVGLMQPQDAYLLLLRRFFLSHTFLLFVGKRGVPKLKMVREGRFSTLRDESALSLINSIIKRSCSMAVWVDLVFD